MTRTLAHLGELMDAATAEHGGPFDKPKPGVTGYLREYGLDGSFGVARSGNVTVGPLASPKRIAYGSTGTTLFVLEDGHQTTLDHNGAVVRRVALGDPTVEAISYDASSRSLVGCSSQSNRLYARLQVRAPPSVSTVFSRYPRKGADRPQWGQPVAEVVYPVRGS